MTGHLYLPPFEVVEADEDNPTPAERDFQAEVGDVQMALAESFGTVREAVERHNPAYLSHTLQQ